MDKGMKICFAGSIREGRDKVYDYIKIVDFLEKYYVVLDTMNKYGIKHYNIYENLEQVKTPGGKRTEPLCKKYIDNNICNSVV